MLAELKHAFTVCLKIIHKPGPVDWSMLFQQHAFFESKTAFYVLVGACSRTLCRPNAAGCVQSCTSVETCRACHMLSRSAVVTIMPIPMPVCVCVCIAD